MKKSLLVAPALSAAFLLSLAGCAQAPGTDTPSAAPAGSASGSTSASADSSGFRACMVSDSGGFDDKSFNQTSYKGMKDAAAELGIPTSEVESAGAADFAGNIQSMVDAKCTMIVTVGFLLSDDTVAAAKKHPDIDFAIVDNNDAKYAAVKNLKPLVFNTAESSFLAGYVAAGMSKTGKVGTFGGAKYPTVTIFMDGFSQGVDYFNKQKGKSVQLLGWNAAKQDGQFVSGGFEDVQGGQRTAQGLVSQGADILFPVAGPAGEGALQAAKASSGKVNAIWVDTDGCVSAASYCPQIITSVYKGMDVAVTDAIKAAKDKSFDNTPFVGTLKNAGTGISPYHQFDSKVPADLKADVDKIKTGIEDGSIKITSKSQPSQ